uniref:Ig-like domain-containing protein n=1 Tax=Esox lucius TaxID=8010 RepID=A0AAY5K209_ESOLU
PVCLLCVCSCSTITAVGLLLKPVSNASITGPAEHLFANESSANLTCEGAGHITLRQWMKDGQPLPPGDNLFFSEDNRTVSISPVMRHDAGEYKCYLANPASFANASHIVIVNCEYRSSSNLVLWIRFRHSLSQKYFQGPLSGPTRKLMFFHVLADGPDSMTILSPDTAEVETFTLLYCSVVSVPPARFTWLFNGQQTSVHEAGYVITSISYNNSGDYSSRYSGHSDVGGCYCGSWSLFRHKS